MHFCTLISSFELFGALDNLDIDTELVWKQLEVGAPVATCLAVLFIQCSIFILGFLMSILNAPTRNKMLTCGHRKHGKYPIRVLVLLY